MLRRTIAVVLTGLVVASIAGSAGAVTPAAPPGDASSSAYAGTHVSFETSGNAIADYAVDNATVLDSVKTQSQSETGLGGAISGSLSSKTHVKGAGLSVASKTKASAKVKTQSGATIQAHDDGHGILTVESGDKSQVVVANLSSGTSATSEGNGQVAVTKSDGTKGTFLVVGNGTVTVNDQGNVTAKLGPHATLAFRAYPNGKSQRDDAEESLISNGTAAAEVYVMNQGGSTVADTVNYSSDFSTSARQSAQSQVTVTADNAQHDGKVVITHVSKRAVGELSNLSVTVDGKAAAKASSYSALKAAAAGGDQSKYMVKQTSSGSASASASADVLIAFNHFSTRQATISGNQQSSGTTSGGNTTSSATTDTATSSSSGGSSGNGGSGGTTSSSSPGFGVLAGALALVGAALLARRRD